MPRVARKRLRKREPAECTAIIADVVGSRGFRGGQRRLLQQRLGSLVAAINERYSEAILARFIITTGDEFQGLLGMTSCLPDLLWDLEREIESAEIRVGIGFGTLETDLAEYAVGMDGPVWHYARAAITIAKERRRLGGVFRGFGARDDMVLNGLARLLFEARRRATARQLQIAQRLRAAGSSATQTRVADQLRISKQTVSKQLRAAAWDSYKEGEQALRAALEPFDRSALGERR